METFYYAFQPTTERIIENPFLPKTEVTTIRTLPPQLRQKFNVNLLSTAAPPSDYLRGGSIWVNHLTGDTFRQIPGTTKWEKEGDPLQYFGQKVVLKESLTTCEPSPTLEAAVDALSQSLKDSWFGRTEDVRFLTGGDHGSVVFRRYGNLS